MTFSRTTSENPGFIKLVKLLDAELAIKDGEEHAFYAQYNGIDEIKHVIMAYLDEQFTRAYPQRRIATNFVNSHQL